MTCAHVRKEPNFRVLRVLNLRPQGFLNLVALKASKGDFRSELLKEGLERFSSSNARLSEPQEKPKVHHFLIDKYFCFINI